MRGVLRAISTSACIGLAVAALAACASSSESHTAAQLSKTSQSSTGSRAQTESQPTPQVGDEVVARIDGYAITRGALLDWMREQVGEVFYEVSTHPAPARLVAEPANYSACVATLKTIAPIPGSRPSQPQPSTRQLRTKCEQIYQEFKESALSYLISSYLTLAFTAAHGITVSGAEIHHKLTQLKAERYPIEGEFQRYLATHRRTLAQELFLVKNALIQQKLQAKLRSSGRQFIEEATTAVADAECRPGYLVKYCRGYERPASERSPSGSVLLEEVARWRPETAHGFTGRPVA
jgi:hypothetical protein